MDDLNARLDKLLEDPSLSDRVMGVLNSLGVQTDTDGNGTGGMKGDSSPPQDADAVNIGQLLGLFSAVTGKGSQGSELLDAIAPYLRPSRRKHVEEAKTLMTVWRLLPLLGSGEDKKDEGG